MPSLTIDSTSHSMIDLKSGVMKECQRTLKISEVR